MAVRLLQVSDLHVGSADPESGAVTEALRELVAAEAPALVVASGDLTHRNLAEQHDRAAAVLRSLGPPVLAVPGNHDIPALPPARLTRPFAAFRAVWGEHEPIAEVDGAVACGLASVRPWLYQEGVLSSAQIERAGAAFASAPPGALRVAVIHHHLLGAPWRTAKKAVARRARVLSNLVEAGAELVMSGHVHQGTIAERREFQVGPEALVIVTCPGLGRPRPHRSGEARGLHLVDADDATIAIRTLVWTGARFDEVAERRFRRGG